MNPVSVHPYSNSVICVDISGSSRVDYKAETNNLQVLKSSN